MNKDTNIIEGNIIMAEFMKLPLIKEDLYETPFTQWKWTASFLSGEGYDTTNEFTAKELRYDDSWDWLMTCIQKIANLEEVLTDMDEYYFILDQIPSITDTYNAVLTFIKQYNQTKEHYIEEASLESEEEIIENKKMDNNTPIR